MRTRGAFLGIGSVAVLALIGCQQPVQDDSVLPRADDPIVTRPEAPSLEPPAAFDAIDVRIVSGELSDVDLEARTFFVSAEGIEHVFTFTDATTITGAPGTQGLAAREGDRVTVRYREENGMKSAASITLLE